VNPPLRMLLPQPPNPGEQARSARRLPPTQRRSIVVPSAPRRPTHMGAICAAHRRSLRATDHAQRQQQRLRHPR
jgi:hypothetical protein